MYLNLSTGLVWPFVISVDCSELVRLYTLQKKKLTNTVIHHPMLHHRPVLRSYNIPHGHPISKINKQRHSNILNDPPHKISSKTDKFWMYYSQIIFGCYVFPLSVTPMFYLYLIQKSFNKLCILEICSSWFRQIYIFF